MSILSTLAPASVLLSSTAVMFGMLDMSVFDEDPTYTEHFTPKDHAAFDRSFEYYGTTCDVGIERKKICFGSSPFEEQIEIGRPMPAHAPAMHASIPVILRTSLKPSEYSTHRYGKTLVLVEDDTGVVVDKLDLLTSYPEQERRPVTVQYAKFHTPVSTTKE